MQVISSLVSLQADALDDPVFRGVFDDLRDQVRAMALAHEKLYQSESLAHIDFAEYTRGLTTYLVRAYGHAVTDIRMTLELDPVLLTIESAVPCGLILNELITNAFKHALPRAHRGGDRRLPPRRCGRPGVPGGARQRHRPARQRRLAAGAVAGLATRADARRGKLRGTVDLHNDHGNRRAAHLYATDHAIRKGTVPCLMPRY